MGPRPQAERHDALWPGSALFDDLGQRPFVLRAKHLMRAELLAVRPVGVEVQYPVPNRPQAHDADLSHRVPRATIVNHR